MSSSTRFASAAVRLSFRLGSDAYVGGHGLMKVGPSVNTGVEFDQGALIALWGEALVFPAAWETRTDIRWEPGDEHTARLTIEGPEGQIPITVGFDPNTGFLGVLHRRSLQGHGPEDRLDWEVRRLASGSRAESLPPVAPTCSGRMNHFRESRALNGLRFR